MTRAAIDPMSSPPYADSVAKNTEDMIRDAILAECQKRGLNPYQLWKLVDEAGGVSRATIYAFFNGQTTLNTENAATIMKALGLSVCRPKK